jgi:amino acid adenylation domain-containing protein
MDTAMTTVMTTDADAAEMSSTSKELSQWMLHQLNPERGVCNIGFAVRVETTLRWWPARAALNHLVRRHPALRTRVRFTGTELRKRYLPADEVDLDLKTHAGTEETLSEQVSSLVARRMDLTDGLFVAAHLILLPGASVLCVALHHLIADVGSIQVMLREFVELYDVYAANQEVPAHLRDEVPPHNERTPDADTMRYWTEHLAGLEADRQGTANARPVPSRPTFAGDCADHTFGRDAVAAVAQLRARTRATDNIVLLAAYYLLLAKHGAGPDLAVGVPVTTRRTPAAERAVGYHVNTLPVRVRVDPDADFDTLVASVRAAFLGGLEHAEASFEAMRDALPTRSAQWRVPLFRHQINFRPTELSGMTVAGKPLRIINSHPQVSRLDVELVVWVGAAGIDLTAQYSTEVYDQAAVAAMLARYEALLVAAAAAPGVPVGELDLTSGADRALAASVNETRRELPADTVADLIAEQARRTPDAPAVDDWSYRRLLGTAETVREELRQAGVRPGDLVALHASRGAPLAAAVLGTWAAGAAYLALDPAHPVERLRYQLDDAGVAVVLADGAPPAECAAGRTVIALDGLAPADTAAPAEPAPAGRAYVLYTSGSTGRPKGVEVGHAALANLIRHFADDLAVTPADRVLWSTTFSFDISALELLAPLAVGARVVVAPADAHLDPAALAKAVLDGGITVAQATPTAWRRLAPLLAGKLAGARLLCGGEEVGAPVAEELLATGARVLNVYGPTEATIWSTAEELRSPVPERVPIGRPIANTTVHVLDESGRPVPPDVPGELYLGGTGLAMGYLGDAERTARSFPDHPRFGRLYRTGDLVRQLPDGRLEFRGRVDRQAKIRGHRVELGEIEATIERLDLVRAAAVCTVPDRAGDTGIACAVQVAGDAPADLAERLREHAARWLPAAAVPGRFLVVDGFPTTANGKVDHRALADVFAVRAPAAPERLPDEPRLRTLVELWREVLDDATLGAGANFFLSGGHSLAAVELAERVTAVFGTDTHFIDVFEAPTPTLLAERLHPAAVPS